MTELSVPSNEIPFVVGDRIGTSGVTIRITQIDLNTRRISATVENVDRFWSDPMRGNRRFTEGMTLDFHPESPNANRWKIGEPSDLPVFILSIKAGHEKALDFYR